MSYDILTEEFGGQVQCAKVSAKSGEGIDELLEKVLLQVRNFCVLILSNGLNENNLISHATATFYFLLLNRLR